MHAAANSATIAALYRRGSIFHTTHTAQASQMAHVSTYGTTQTGHKGMNPSRGVFSSTVGCTLRLTGKYSECTANASSIQPMR